MKIHERAAQIWAVLALAARNRQTITYEILSKLIGVPRPGLGQLLEPIQSFCLVKALPPLTILVVREESGLPGEGFIAAHDVPSVQQTVFTHDWLEDRAPTPEELDEAVKARPSNGKPL